MLLAECENILFICNKFSLYNIDMSTLQEVNYIEKIRKIKVEAAQILPNPCFTDYNRYIQSYSMAYFLKNHMEGQRKLRSTLMEKIEDIEHRIDSIDIGNQIVSSSSKAKRQRRLANEINRNYICAAERCQRSYGSLGSLQQHQRLKHPDINFNESTVNIQWGSIQL